jgi:hypothetical protein
MHITGIIPYAAERMGQNYRLRNLVFKFADIDLLSPEMEKLGLLGETDRSRRRGVDVSKELGP